MLEHLINTLNAETVVSVVGQELGFFNTSSVSFFVVVLYTFWSFLLTENRQMMNILQYKFEKSCLRNKTKM